MLVETVGIILGISLGLTVGDVGRYDITGPEVNDGREVGKKVGEKVGFFVGFIVGRRVGFRDIKGYIVEGLHVGSVVGENVG